MLFVFFFSFILSTVDRNNFRSCKDMRFCRENQKISNKWSIDPKSAQIKDNIFTANLLLDGTSNDISLSIYALKTGGIRFRMTPTEKESFQRFDLSKNAYVINQDILNSASPIKDSSSSDSEFNIVFEDYQGISLIIEYSTLKITIKQNDKIVTVINGRNQLVFEHHRNVQVPPEVFNGFTDYIKNGATAVGSDFFFPGDVKLTGLSERASPVNLADTEVEEDTEQNSENDEEAITSEPLRLFNTDSFEFEADSPHNLYSSIPFCHAHSKEISAALFWINPCDTFINIKTYSENDFPGRELKFVSESGFVDFILFYGQNQGISNDGFKQIMKQYCEITGYPMFAPLFALGYHQSRWSYATQHETGVVMRGLDELNIPFDSIWLDVDCQSSKTPFTIARQGFPNPSNLISELANNDRYLVRLCDPHFPRNNDYKQYRESHRSNFLVLAEEEKGAAPFVGDCWPGPCVWPDFLNPSAFRWYSQQYSFESERENSGPNVFYWNDMNEPSIFKSDQSTFPKHLIHFGGYEDREVHNIYGLLNSASTFQGLLARNQDFNKRPFILTRSFFAGSQKFAWTWTGDNTASWEHLAVSLSMVLTSGACGMPFTGADLGGFLKSPDGSLLIRWFQLGAWLYPFFREHCHHKSARREPFMYDGDEQECLKDAVVQRYKLLPLWYTATRRANLTGVPSVLPLWAIFNGESFHDVESVAVLDEKVYVAPVLEDDVDDIEVIAPPGVWYRFETGKKLQEPSETIPVTIKDTPAFLRGGKIIPTFSEVGKSAISTISSCPLTLYVALDVDGKAEGDLYFDDGESYNYLKGEFVYRKFVCINGQLKSVKGDDKQESIPELVRNSIINKVVVYGAAGVVDSPVGYASFENGILIIQNLNFNINDDWTLKIQ